VVVVVAAGVGMVLGRSRAPETPPPPPPGLTATETSPDSITVHVSGAVQHPGLVVVAAGSRVADVVAAAGGSTPDARLADINLASPVGDGTQIVVPGGTGGEAAAPAPADGLVHVNTAGVSELEELPGVGPVLAERIVAHRKEHGPFSTVEDLLDVPGIGEAKLSSMRDQIAVP
jgi:competence protein ComEA